MSLGAPTIAVIGAGLSEPAPRTHHPDFRRMTADGAVMSPFPCHQKAAPWTFLSRNPWIALMSDCVIVVQAGAKSGALHTGRFALSQDIPLWVVPGAFDNPLHRGCHQLISEGGRILTCEDEWAQGLALDFGTEKGPDHGGDTREPEFAASVWRSFDDRPRTMDELDARLAHSQSELSAAVVRLEVEGWLRRGPDGGFVRAWPGT